MSQVTHKLSCVFIFILKKDIQMSQQHLELKPTLKLSWVYAMAVGSAIGWGAFVLPYQWLVSSGLTAVLTGFAIATLLISIIAINYGYATRRIPVTGGGIVFALSSLGHMHSFIAGWSLMLGYIGIVALNASAVSLVFRLIFPDFMQLLPLYEIAGWTIYAPEVVISSVFLCLFAYLNVKNTAFSGKVQFIAVLLLLFAVAIIFTGTGINFLNNPSSLVFNPPENVSFWTACFTIVAFAPWAYVGFDSIPQIAGEFKFSAQKIMKLLIASIFSASLLYMAMVSASAFAFGESIQQYAQSAWATGSAIENNMSKVGLVLLTLAVSMGVLTGLNGFYLAASRVILTMGRSQMLPSIFSKLHPKYQTPYIAIYSIMLICLISPWFGRSALLWIVDMTSVGIAMSFFYTCYCTYTLGKNGQVLGQTLQEKSKLQQWIGLLGCVISLGFLTLLLVPSSPGSLSQESWYALSLWLVLGLALFYSRKKQFYQLSQQQLYQRLTQS